jgi:hypothetical protein
MGTNRVVTLQVLRYSTFAEYNFIHQALGRVRSRVHYNSLKNEVANHRLQVLTIFFNNLKT